MRTSMLSAAALCCLLTLAAPRPTVSAQEGSGPSWERYQVLTERNIFSRVRGRRPEPPTRRVTEAPRPPQRYLILTGTVETGGEWLAFIEDTRSSQTRIYWAGDSIAQGSIADIHLDGLTYAAGETPVAVNIGDYVGGAMTPSGSAPAAPAAEATPTAEPALSGDAATLLERLRQRRQEEMGR